MPIAIDGDGTITGVSVGGLPDGIVDVDMLASGATTFSKYAIVSDVKSAGTHAGGFTSGAWRTRDLNTEIDPDSIVSISSNQFTLQAGTYMIDWKSPAFGVNTNQSRLYNVTDSSVTASGSPGYSYNNDGTIYVNHFSVGSTRITLTAAKAFEIQHQCTTTRVSWGLGFAGNFGIDEIYTVVKIFKEA